MALRKDEERGSGSYLPQSGNEGLFHLQGEDLLQLFLRRFDQFECLLGRPALAEDHHTGSYPFELRGVNSCPLRKNTSGQKLV